MSNTIRNPKYNAGGTIDCEVYSEIHGWLPFTASPDDVELHGRVLYEAITAGIYGDIETYIEPEKTDAELIAIAEAKAKEYIGRIDTVASNNILWTQLKAEQQAELTSLRYELLSISDKDGYPADVAWPDMPDYI